jgi:hypothetical protein
LTASRRLRIKPRNLRKLSKKLLIKSTLKEMPFEVKLRKFAKIKANYVRTSTNVFLLMSANRLRSETSSG